jgi:hypothetical protein
MKVSYILDAMNESYNLDALNAARHLNTYAGQETSACLGSCVLPSRLYTGSHPVQDIMRLCPANQ